ncbi:MAG: hypothetical protein PVH40_00045 [Gemmatimonadales bacterium]
MLVLDTRLTVGERIEPASGVDSSSIVTALCFGPDGTTLYVAHTAGEHGVVTRVARPGGHVLGLQNVSEPTVSGLWLLHDPRMVIAAGTTSLHLLPADLAGAGSVLAACVDSIVDLTPSSVRHRLYTVCGNDDLVEIDTELAMAVRSASLVPRDSSPAATCGASQVALSPSGSIVYVLCRDSGALLLVDRLTLQPFASVDVGPGGLSMALTPDGGHAAITRPGADEVVVVDLPGRAVGTRIRLESPAHAAIGADGRLVHVTRRTESRRGRVTRVTLADGAVRDDTAALPGSLRIAVWPTTRSPSLWWD